MWVVQVYISTSLSRRYPTVHIQVSRERQGIRARDSKPLLRTLRRPHRVWKLAPWEPLGCFSHASLFQRCHDKGKRSPTCDDGVQAKEQDKRRFISHNSLAAKHRLTSGVLASLHHSSCCPHLLGTSTARLPTRAAKPKACARAWHACPAASADPSHPPKALKLVQRRKSLRKPPAGQRLVLTYL